MGEKEQILSQLEKEYQTWVDLLDSLSEEQITSIQFVEMSVKDKLAHLWAWQQRTLARLEAALEQHEPTVPYWFDELVDETDEALDRVNALMFENLRDKSWQNVYADWKNSYQRVIELAKRIPEIDLLLEGKYPWLNGYPLIAVLNGTYEHHHTEHLDEIVEYANGNKHNPVEK